MSVPYTKRAKQKNAGTFRRFNRIHDRASAHESSF